MSLPPDHPDAPHRRRLRPTRMLRVLPSLFTLGNLLCGFAAVFNASRIGLDSATASGVPHLAIAAGLVFAGMVFDALDGRIARLTHQTSDLGEQLDSMADMVTFGVAPAFMVIQLVGIGNPIFGETHLRWDTHFDRFVFVVACVYTACTALRLARFNAELEQPDERDHATFKGLPSPAAAGTVCSLVLLHQWLIGRPTPGGAADAWPNIAAVGMVLIALLAAVAMVSTMRYVHVMNRWFRDRAPIHYVAAVVFILLPLLTYPQVTLAAVCVGYALSAPIFLALRKMRLFKASHPPHAEHPASSEEQPPLKMHR